jgi:tol-pal system protein YbgF
MSADQVYSLALNEYTKQNFDQAIRGFQAFIVQFPRDSRVADAQWWMGDSLYAQQNYPQAIREYDVLIRTYPDSRRVPAAMFKQGLAYLQLNDPSGCRVLRDVLANYGRTREASRAREELRQASQCK